MYWWWPQRYRRNVKPPLTHRPVHSHFSLKSTIRTAVTPQGRKGVPVSKLLRDVTRPGSSPASVPQQLVSLRIQGNHLHHGFQKLRLRCRIIDHYHGVVAFLQGGVFLHQLFRFLVEEFLSLRVVRQCGVQIGLA